MASSIIDNESKGPANANQPGQVTTSQQTFAGNKTLANGLKTIEIQAATANPVAFKNSSGATTIVANETNSLSILNNIQQNGSNIISWVEVTPAYTEWSFAGVASSSVTLNPSSIPANARYVLLDVFITASASDHFNLSLGRTALSDLRNWTNPQGSQPSAYFVAGVGSRNVVCMTHHGNADGYSTMMGKWWSSVITPCDGRTLYYNLSGVDSVSTTGWIYVIARAYSL
jgi:hypothetical protein